jgi:hypothetical protein
METFGNRPNYNSSFAKVTLSTLLDLTQRQQSLLYHQMTPYRYQNLPIRLYHTLKQNNHAQ